MYKIPNEVKQFIDKIMETWKVELTPREISKAEVYIQRGIFQGDALSPLLFAIVMMSLNAIFRKCTSGQNPRKLQGKNPQLHVHGRYQTVWQKRKRIGNLNTDCDNIQSRYRNGVWQRKMRHASNEKRERDNGTAKSRKKSEGSEKRKSKILQNIERDIKGINTWAAPASQDNRDHS